MTFTYSGDPSSSRADAVRFILADTAEDSAAFTDEEVAWLVGQWPDEYAAAIAGAAMLEARYAREADSVTRTVGDLTIAQSYKDRSAGYAALRAALVEQRQALNPPLPWVDPAAITPTDGKATQGKTADLWVGRLDFRQA